MLDYFKPLRSMKMIRTAMLGFIIFAAFNCFRANENKNGGYPTRFKYVVTEYGSVRGHTANDGDDEGEYVAFLGIPYAAPPVGEYRFQNPRPPSPWEGIYDATRPRKCLQEDEGEEDCLVLNIFTPLVIQKSLPVLVYIHGGSFLMGSGPISGVGHLIQQNIIVVTINYRLGALGFLCLGIKEAPGNAGLKDQVAALKFINKNIAHFGGNPKNVTLYGMSAGGASVEYLIHSKWTKNLFHQAIIESGSVANPWAFDVTPFETARAVAALVNITTEYPRILYDHFKRLPIETLTEINFKYYAHLTNGTFGFAPCIEKSIDGVQSFLVKQPREVLKIVSRRKIPTMFLFSTLEGLYLRSIELKEQNYKERMESNFFDFMPADLIVDESLRIETAEKIKRFYFGESTDTIQYLNFFGDSLILHGLLDSVESHARSCNHVYLMEFGYKGEMGSFESLYPDINMAGHGDVVKYAILNKKLKNENDKTTVKRVCTLIANYVKYGNPTPYTSSLLPVTWPTVCSRKNMTNMKYLYLGDTFEVSSHPYWNRKLFWDSLYQKSEGIRSE